jgi:three-Cys-motif partner protein
MSGGEAHAFGGEWTETKLRIVEAYAKSFQTALKNQQFETWYIDPFAGSGERVQKMLTGDLMQGRPLEEELVTFSGSARRALEITPPFAHYRFADTKPAHIEALQSLKSEYAERDIKIFPGDGNECIRKILSNKLWCGHQSAWKQRGMVFLDPYGMNVNWETLQQIAATQRLDVWFLFAAKAVRQQLGPSLESVDAGKAGALDRFFGEPSWREEFYGPVPGQMSFLGDLADETETSVNLQAIGQYARSRFQTEFCWVSQPKSLRVGNVPDFFQLYCMTNNQSAKTLIERLHAGVVKAQQRASRHTSAH